jgi:hypothetical protein
MGDPSFTRMVFDEPIVSLEVASIHSNSLRFSLSGFDEPIVDLEVASIHSDSLRRADCKSEV